MIEMKYFENELSAEELAPIYALQMECNEYDCTVVDYSKHISKNSTKIKIVKNGALLGFVEINKGLFDNESTIWMVLHPSIRTTDYIDEIMRKIHIECDKGNLKRRKFLVEANNEYVIKLINSSTVHLLYSTYEMRLEAENLNTCVGKANNISISEIERNDFEEIAYICSKAFNTSIEDELDYLASNLTSSSRTVFVSKLDGDIVGTVSVDISEFVNIADLVVKESSRGRGIGKDILLCIISDLLAQKHKTYKLSVKTANERALVMYKDIGFAIVNKFNFYNLIDHLS